MPAQAVARGGQEIQVPGAWRTDSLVNAPYHSNVAAYAAGNEPGWAGGLVGAVANAKERKRRHLAGEEAERQRPRNRPGTHADGTPDGTLGVADVAARLAQHNGGGSGVGQAGAHAPLSRPS
jgi:hypothetical protein